MSYRDKTYVIFDGDNDIWAYGYMKGWNKSERIDFNFDDAHELEPLTSRADEEAYIKRRLRERFAASCQVIVLVGEKTRFLYKFVRWEIETALELKLPIIVANLNKKRRHDDERCPAILDDAYAIHVGYYAKIIKFALDNFAATYAANRTQKSGPHYYKDDVYLRLGITL